MTLPPHRDRLDVLRSGRLDANDQSPLSSSATKAADSNASSIARRRRQTPLRINPNISLASLQLDNIADNNHLDAQQETESDIQRL